MIKTKNFCYLILTLFALASCGNNNANFYLSGKIENLNEAKLFLQRIEDSVVVNLDSVEIYGDPSFKFSTYLKEPQILSVYLDKPGGDKYDDRIRFFAEKGKMTLNTNLKRFTVAAQIKGSENNRLLVKYDSVMNKFNASNLDLMKQNFLAAKRADTAKIKQIQQKFHNLLKRKYLYTINFAVEHSDMAIAPYLAVTEIRAANLSYLEKIYTALTPEIKKSKYGEKLHDLLEKRRQNQKNSKGGGEKTK